MRFDCAQHRRKCVGNPAKSRGHPRVSLVVNFDDRQRSNIMRKTLTLPLSIFMPRTADSLTAANPPSSRFHWPLQLAACALLGLAIPAVAQRPPIRHVFTIVLENKSYAETF